MPSLKFLIVPFQSRLSEEQVPRIKKTPGYSFQCEINYAFGTVLADLDSSFALLITSLSHENLINCGTMLDIEIIQNKSYN